MIMALYIISKMGKKTVMIYAGHIVHAIHTTSVWEWGWTNLLKPTTVPRARKRITGSQGTEAYGKKKSLCSLCLQPLINITVTQMGRKPSLLW